MFCETGKFLCRSEQPRVKEIENGPQIPQPVFDRRARQRESRFCLEFLGSAGLLRVGVLDRKSTRLNSSHGYISYAVFCLKKKKKYIHLKLAVLKTRSVRAVLCVVAL